MYTEFYIIQTLGLQPGDRIVVPKSAFGLIQHFAIYLGSDANGFHYISENVIGEGVVLTRAYNFFSNNPEITRIEKFEGTVKQRKSVVDSALAKLGQSYSLITYNCEHYVNEVSTGKLSSRQVTIATTLLAVFVLVGIIHE